MSSCAVVSLAESTHSDFYGLRHTMTWPLAAAMHQFASFLGSHSSTVRPEVHSVEAPHDHHSPSPLVEARTLVVPPPARRQREGLIEPCVIADFAQLQEPVMARAHLLFLRGAQVR